MHTCLYHTHRQYCVIQCVSPVQHTCPAVLLFLGRNHHSPHHDLVARLCLCTRLSFPSRTLRRSKCISATTIASTIVSVSCLGYHLGPHFTSHGTMAIWTSPLFHSHFYTHHLNPCPSIYYRYKTRMTHCRTRWSGFEAPTAPHNHATFSKSAS